MASKLPVDQKSWEISGFTINIEFFNTEIIVKDECGNSMNISKQNRLSLILNLKGSFVSSQKHKKNRVYFF